MTDLPPDDSPFLPFPGYEPGRPGLPVGNEPLFGPPRPPMFEGYEDYPYEITIYNQYGEPFSNTAEGWYRTTLADRDDLMEYYGMDNIDLVYSYIQAMEEVAAQEGIEWHFDWDQWRADYDAAH